MHFKNETKITWQLVPLAWHAIPQIKPPLPFFFLYFWLPSQNAVKRGSQIVKESDFKKREGAE